MPIAGAMRRSSPVLVISLFILIGALACSTLGNSRRDFKTLIGAVLYVVGGISMTDYFTSPLGKKTSRQSY